MTQLLLYSIGPVQDLIAAARRGRDLWFGSWLLSELARCAARTAAKRHGLESLVMPAPDSPDQLADPALPMPNKLLLLIPGDAVDLATALDLTVKTRLSALACGAFDHVTAILGSDLSRHFLRARAEAQVADLLDLHHVAVPLTVDRDYAGARRLAEVLLASAKSARTFQQPDWACGHPIDVPKSHLDGHRESVLHDDLYREARSAGSQARHRLSALGLRPGERLCGVGLLKRWGHVTADGAARQAARQVSTSHLASWSTRRLMDPTTLREGGHEPETIDRVCPQYRAAAKRAVGELLDLGAQLTDAPGSDPVLHGKDGHFLFESRLPELLPGAQHGDIQRARQVLVRLFAQWRARSKEAGLPIPGAPSPYFAVLLADGDHMGRALDAMDSPDAHRQATRLLAAFAAQAQEIVTAHGGNAVYAGGDDVLAMLPIQTALGCAGALQAAFMERVSLPLTTVTGSGTGPTLSVGLAIGHHLTPLRDTLHNARLAEAHAKHGLGRDAWAVHLDKRGGSPVTIGGHWSELPPLLEVQRCFSARDGRLPRGLPYALRVVADALPLDATGLSAIDLASLREVLHLELLRVLKQKKLLGAPGGDAVLALVDSDPVGGLAVAADRLIVARALSGMHGEAA